MEELINKLKKIQQSFIDMAIQARDSDQLLSYNAFSISETCGKAAEALARMIPQEMETEGGGHSWWNVCPECHGIIDTGDHYCRICGQALK